MIKLPQTPTEGRRSAASITTSSPNFNSFKSSSSPTFGSPMSGVAAVDNVILLNDIHNFNGRPSSGYQQLQPSPSAIGRPRLNSSGSLDRMDRSQSFTRSQGIVLAALILGYTGFYFCRTDLTVTINILQNSLPGIDKSDIGYILSLGYFCYSCGKFLMGPVIDRWGGSAVFFTGLIVSIVCTFILSMLPITYVETDSGVKLSDPHAYVSRFALIWCVLRFSQSGGWPAIIQMLSLRFPEHMHARVFGIASLSYGAGDALVRLVLGLYLRQLDRNYGDGASEPSNASAIWHSVFTRSYLLAMCLALVYWKSMDYVDSLDSTLELTLPPVKLKPPVLSSILQLFSRVRFWILAFMAMGITFLRETILLWGAVFLAEYCGVSHGNAAMLSLLFPLIGSMGSMYAGFMVDQGLSRSRDRLLISMLGLVTILLAIAIIGTQSMELSAAAGCIFLSMLSFVVMGPFSFVDASLPLELSTTETSGLTIGITHFFGYLGAIFAGHNVGVLASGHGWNAVVQLMFGMSAVILALSMLWWKSKGR